MARDQQLAQRYTAEEVNAINQAAEAASMSTSEYVRLAALKRVDMTSVAEELGAEPTAEAIIAAVRNVRGRRRGADRRTRAAVREMAHGRQEVGR